MAGSLILLGFTLLLLWPLCVGRTLYWGDILLYFAPMYRYEQISLQHGQIPLWNSAVNEGQPFVGNPQMGVFYPATVLLPFLPAWMYLNVLTIAHVFLCGVFMTAYLKRWTTQRWSALAGGLVYMGSECLIGRLQFPPMIFTAAYFPLLLLSIDRFLDARTSDPLLSSQLSISSLNIRQKLGLSGRVQGWGALLQLALVVGCMVLAAHPQMAYLILMFSGCYALGRLARLHLRETTPTTRTSSWRAQFHAAGDKALSMLLACVLGLMLAAVQILPAIQLMLESPREQLTPAQANRFILEPAHLLTLIWPRFWGHPATADFWGGGNAWEPAFFVGWLPLLLIGAACLRHFRQRRTQFWMVTAFFGIWLAFGTTGGLYWLIFKIVPGMSNFHDPARFLVYTTFAFAVLTAFGCDVAERRWQDSPQTLPLPLSRISVGAMRVLCLLSIAAPLWWYGRDWNPTVPHSFLDRHPQYPFTTPNGRSSPGPSFPALAVNPQRTYQPDLEFFWKHYITDGYSDYRATNAVQFQASLNTLMPNLGMTEGVLSASGYEPVPVSAPAALDHLGRQAIWRGEPNLSRLLSLMGASTLVLPAVTRPNDPRFLHTTSAFRLPVIALHNRDVLPSAWLVRRTRHIEGKTRISAALAAPDFHPDEAALVCDSLRIEETLLEWPIGGGNRREEEKRRKGEKEKAEGLGEWGTGKIVPLFSDAHTIELNVECDERPGFLVVAAAAFPGWTATVDGRNAAIHRADGALMGLFLAPGAHQVLLRYRPVSYRVGLYLSLLACGILCAGAGLFLPLRSSQNITSAFSPSHSAGHQEAIDIDQDIDQETID